MAASAELLQLTNRKHVSEQWFDKHNISDDTDSNGESNHEELLKNIKSLDGKSKRKRHKGPLRSESSQKISEFHLNSEGDDGKVNLGDLVGSLQASSYNSKLKKSLESMQRTGKTVDVPLAKPTAERIQRIVAYKETSKDISKWEPTVQKNRQAEHLSFPLDSYKPSEMSTGSLTNNFKPQTPLEQEIAMVLKNSSHMLERNDKELSKEEEEALKTMTLEEALERRKELQRLRALQSYYEQKCRRMKKIKSKKFHRIKRRAEKRAASKHTFEQLQKDNPELAMTELEKAERLRVAERMSLKHRNTSKWAKNIITKGIKDLQTRQALAEQLRISRQLTETKTAQCESDDESDNNTEDTTDNLENIRNFALRGDNSQNPWLFNDGKSKSENTGDGEGNDNSEERIRKLQPITVNEAKQHNDSEESDGDDLGNSIDDETFELMDECEVRSKAKKKKKDKGKKSLGKTVEEADVKTPKRQNEEKRKKKKGKESPKRKITEEEKRKVKTKKKRKKLDVKDSELSENDVQDIPNDGVLLMESGGRDDVELVQEETRTNQTREEIEDSPKFGDSTVNLNPEKVFQIEDLGSANGLLDVADDGSDDEMRAQRMTIQEAFANDDVIEEFMKEKEDASEASKPKDLDTSLPGWGDWGGPGVDETKRKKKFTVRAKPAPPRKDAKLAHVIINEERDRKFTKNQVAAVPFPYTSRDQWERSIRAPLGKHWNTTSVHEKLVKPRVTTLPGTIIEPIKPTKEIERTRVSGGETGEHRHRGKRRVKSLESGMKIHD